MLKAAGGAAALAAFGGIWRPGTAEAAVDGFGLHITDHAVFDRMHYYRFATSNISWQPGGQRPAARRLLLHDLASLPGDVPAARRRAGLPQVRLRGRHPRSHRGTAAHRRDARRRHRRLVLQPGHARTRGRATTSRSTWPAHPVDRRQLPHLGRVQRPGRVGLLDGRLRGAQVHRQVLRPLRVGQLALRAGEPAARRRRRRPLGEHQLRVRRAQRRHRLRRRRSGTRAGSPPTTRSSASRATATSGSSSSPASTTTPTRTSSAPGSGSSAACSALAGSPTSGTSFPAPTSSAATCSSATSTASSPGSAPPADRTASPTAVSDLAEEPSDRVAAATRSPQPQP